MESKSVNVRNRDDVGVKTREEILVTVDDILAKMVALKKSRGLLNKFA